MKCPFYLCDCATTMIHGRKPKSQVVPRLAGAGPGRSGVTAAAAVK
jgi:hypothetical protein